MEILEVYYKQAVVDNHHQSAYHNLVLHILEHYVVHPDHHDYLVLLEHSRAVEVAVAESVVSCVVFKGEQDHLRNQKHEDIMHVLHCKHLVFVGGHQEQAN